MSVGDEMPPNPLPAAASLVISATFPAGVWESTGRRLLCAHYQSCLYVAEQQEWEGFTCTGCRITSEIGDHQKLVDFHGLADLFVEIMQPESALGTEEAGYIGEDD